MCSYVYNWLRGYSIDQTLTSRHNNATHVLLFRNKLGITLRRFSTFSGFSTQKLRKFEMAYNNRKDILYTDGLSKFGNLTLLEFMHNNIPGETVDIDHIPVDVYNRNRMMPEFTERFEPSNYICTCYDSTETCVFHKFMTEKLYIKYTKNDNFTQNPNCSYIDNDGGGLDQSVL